MQRALHFSTLKLFLRSIHPLHHYKWTAHYYNPSEEVCTPVHHGVQGANLLTVFVYIDVAHTCSPYSTWCDCSACHHSKFVWALVLQRSATPAEYFWQNFGVVHYKFVRALVLQRSATPAEYFLQNFCIVDNTKILPKIFCRRCRALQNERLNKLYTKILQKIFCRHCRTLQNERSNKLSVESK